MTAILKVLALALGKGALSVIAGLASERFGKRIFASLLLYCGRYFVKNTTTPHDDAFLNLLRDQLAQDPELNDIVVADRAKGE